MTSTGAASRARATTRASADQPCRKPSVERIPRLSSCEPICFRCTTWQTGAVRQGTARGAPRVCTCARSQDAWHPTTRVPCPSIGDVNVPMRRPSPRPSGLGWPPPPSLAMISEISGEITKGRRGHIVVTDASSQTTEVKEHIVASDVTA
eukprot:13394681-Heterocapsa_arctica.AAC.1